MLECKKASGGLYIEAKTITAKWKVIYNVECHRLQEFTSRM
jgi:hypothetical protein